ncbi:TPA: hypothetical protein DDZ86_03250 [Candidatus Dependentiae bacterium]|nr:MAG: putative transcriptional regulator [candidate division TM6 bacterium GW2011_GWF2_43_87]HBL98633.1 hypothetical protein [Candidatus Dependentiae bacterium]
MKSYVKIVDINQIKQHEQIRKGHLKEIKSQIEADGFINDPIIVDANTMIILDGHHRYNALKQLGLSFSPVFL